MNSVTIILFLFLFSGSLCRTVMQTLDDWQAQSDTLVIVLDENSLPSAQQVFTLSTTGNIIGQERDLELRAVSGEDGAVISVASTQELSLATPTNARGGFVLQYDGLDASMTLNPTGLNHYDLTFNGADALQLFAATDHPVNALITVTSDSSRASTFILVIVPSDEIVSYEIPFVEFLGNADFSDIGSISIEVSTDVNVDVVVTLICTSGPDRTYFINPTCNVVYNFAAQCSENKKEIPEDTSTSSSESSSSSTTSESEILSGEISISVIVQQYFSFTWNNVNIEETGGVDPSETRHFSQSSSGSMLGVSLIMAISVFLL